jgi:hypothetical protein
MELVWPSTFVGMKIVWALTFAGVELIWALIFGGMKFGAFLEINNYEKFISSCFLCGFDS